MSVLLTKDSIDLGIVVADAEAAMAFYRDLLGMEPSGELAMPQGGTVYRLTCGSSTIKLLCPASPPAVLPGGVEAATGFRYFTISVSNIREITDACEAAGHTVVWPVREHRPGVEYSMVEDPDGNWVEFLSTQ